MKALSTTILVVVTTVVILVVALVVLTIFSGGIGQVTPLTQAGSQCITEGQMSGCDANGNWIKPVTWDVPTKKTENGVARCGINNPPNSLGLSVSCSCSNNKVTCS